MDEGSSPTLSSIIRDKKPHGELPWKKWLRAFVVPWDLQASLVYLLLRLEPLVPEIPEMEKKFDLIVRYCLTQSNKMRHIEVHSKTAEHGLW